VGRALQVEVGVVSDHREWIRWAGAVTSSLRRLLLRSRCWFWRSLRWSWWCCWRVTEATVPVPAHWQWWWGLGQWLRLQVTRAECIERGVDFDEIYNRSPGRSTDSTTGGRA
jgi:hypothetical protein